MSYARVTVTARLLLLVFLLYMKKRCGDTAAPDDAAVATSLAEVKRVPKVRLDVLTSHLLHDQDYGELSSSSSLSSASFSAIGSAATTSTTHAAVSRMPLSAVAKAEAQLKKPVSLSHGGLTINFSKEDIQHITDPEVLRLLAGDGGAWRESTQTLRSLAPAALAASPGGTTAMEAHMEALQREIDTFITAVDNEGRSYEIRMGATGHREMLIADDDDDDDDEADAVLDKENERDEEGSSAEVEERVLPEKGSAGEPVLPAASAISEASGNLSREKRESTPAKPSAPPLPHKNTQVTSAPQRPPGTTKNVQPRQTHMRLTPLPPPAPPSSSRVKAPVLPSSSSAPAIPVRPQAGLSDVEEARVAQLLDGEAMAALTASKPFTCTHELVERLRLLEERIGRYAAVRGGPSPSSSPGLEALRQDSSHTDAAAHTGAPDADDNCTQNGRKTATELGNAYMRDSRQAEQAAQQLRSVNQRLRALQRRDEALAMAPADDTPAAVLALRPSWAQPSSPAMEEAEVQQLLSMARAEEARAREAGLMSTTAALPTSADPYAGLRDQLRDASRRATELLKVYDASPPELRRAPSPLGDSGSDTTVEESSSTL